MKLELKNIKFYESMSEETNCFQADLFIDGKKVAYVKNDGRGGCTDYNAYEGMRDKLNEAEAHFKSLPKAKYEKYNFEYQPSVEHAIDDLFENYLEIKAEKKLLTHMKKGVLVGHKDNYSIVSWKAMTLEAILKTKHPVFIDALKKTIAEYKGKGVNILNTNIPEEYLT